MKEKLTLYAINEALQTAMARAEEYAAEHNGEIPAELDKELDTLELARDEKIGACVAYLKGEKSIADALIAEADKLTARAKSHLHSAEWMKGYIASCVGERVKWEGVEGKVSWRESTSVDVSVPVEQLDPAFVRVIPEKREPDKTAIKDAIKNGNAVSGCQLITRQNIQIR